MRIGIRKAHTKACTGASDYINEWQESRNLFPRIVELLQQYHTIIDCTPNENLGWGEWNTGVKTANNSNLDLFFSIHFNSATGNPKGTEACVYSTTGIASNYATKAVNNIASLGFVNRGLKKRTDLAETASINCPSFIIETCFVQSHDGKLYKNIGTEKIARAIANAIDNRVSLIPSTSNEPIHKPSSQTQTQTKEIYRVRKSFSDTSSQIGAYSVLENAILECQKHKDYKVFNSAGVQVYPPIQVIDNEQITSTYKENGKAIVIVDKLNVRSQPNIKNSEIVASYSKGQSFNYNEVYISHSYVWVSYISNSGHKRYVAVKDKKSNVRYANCM